MQDISLKKNSVDFEQIPINLIIDLYILMSKIDLYSLI